MNLGNKLHLDFDFLQGTDCKYISILNTSVYTEKPTGDVMDVTLPGFVVPIRLPFDIEGMNVYNTGILNYSSTISTLPDGVYTFTYRTCPIDERFITKKIIRTCEIECKYLALFSKLHLDCSPSDEDLKKLAKLNNYITAAKANAGICNFLKAADFLQKANNLVLDIDCNC